MYIVLKFNVIHILNKGYSRFHIINYFFTLQNSSLRLLNSVLPFNLILSLTSDFSVQRIVTTVYDHTLLKD